MRKIKSGVVIDKYSNKVCHNPDCSRPLIKETQKHYKCGGCRYLTYCSPQCVTQHWGKHHKYACHAIQNMTFLEYLALNSACPMNDRCGLHTHTKVKTDKIEFARQQLIYYANKMAKDILACQCKTRKKHEPVSTTVMLQSSPCTNMNLAYVYLRCKNVHCKQRKNAQPIFTLFPMSSSHNLLVIIPNQQERPEHLNFINHNSKNIAKLPEGFGDVILKVEKVTNCPKCVGVHLDFRMEARRKRGVEENNNDNSVYVFNDLEDKWELLFNKPEE